MSLYVCVLSGVSAVGLARPGLSRRAVQSVPSSILPVGGGVGGRVSVVRVDQRSLSLSLQVLQRRHRLQDLRLAAAHCRSVNTGSTGSAGTVDAVLLCLLQWPGAGLNP